MRILIVEDEPNIASSVAKALRAEGFKVDWASDGITALQMILSRQYDSVSLDIMLPEMDGLEVCQRIRQVGSDTPVLMLTAKSGENDEVDAFKCGADDFLRKPFSTKVLAARLKSLVRRGSRRRTEGLRVGGLELDGRTRAAVRGGHRIALTPREFSLLEMLMLRAGDAVSKAEIMREVWDVDYETDDNVVEVYIGYLRKKVDLPFGGGLIQTVRGRGYMIDEQGGNPA